VGKDEEQSGVSVSRLPSGRWRAQVHDPRVGHNVSVSKILGGPGTFRTKTEAKDARTAARQRLTGSTSAVTLRQFRARWTTDPLFARPKASTNLHNAERTKAFVERYGSLRIDLVTDQVVGEWLAGGKRSSTVPALRAMFNDAASAKAGRLVDRNPFAGLGIKKTRGLRDVTPPSEEIVWALIAAARKQAGPTFAAWLQVAAFTGMRPGELDALRWDCVDFTAGRLAVREQWSAGSKTFTSPKNGLTRHAILTPPARDALLNAPRESETYCFATLRRTHWTPGARAYHWKATRADVGYDGTLYLATRHFAGWYMTNVLELPAEDVAVALGHTDGGYLVRTLYGHRDTERALLRVANAYEGRANVRPLPKRREAG
jgi:integrase